jgi:hypothetical protein
MPFRAIANSELRAKMTEAYDMARAQLQIDDTNPLTGKLAIEIIALGEKGVSEAKELCMRAIAALEGSNG